MQKGLYIPIQEGLGPYTGCIRTSFYVNGSAPDVRIACDLYLPVDADGTTLSDLPLILHTGAGGRRDDETRDITFTMIANGYAFMRCENRNVGASHGISDSFAGVNDVGADIACVIEWAAAQEWCNGKVGMHGISNKGFVQLTTACNFPEHLVAITPIVCNADFYYVNQPNGVNDAPRMFKMPAAPAWMRRLQIGAPVDDDPAPGYPMATKAALDREGKQHNWFDRVPPDYKSRDWVDPLLGYAPNLVDAPIEYLDRLVERDYRVQQFAGWFDSNASGQLMLHNCIGDHIIVGPWNHGEGNTGHSSLPEGTWDMAKEHLRWFDEALKGIPGGRAKVTYYTINAPEGERWHESDVWPPAGCRRIPFYLSADGGMTDAPDTVIAGALPYTVSDDPDVFNPVGRFDTWITKDLSHCCDDKALCFTTEPFEKDTEVTGHCTASLWVSSETEDGDFIVILEDVSPDGKSQYITSGSIRASYRAETPYEPFNRVGVPYHRCLEAERAPLIPGKPVQLNFCIDATSWYFPTGHALRASIICGEQHQFCQPPCIDLKQPPTITLYTGGSMASRIEVSILPTTIENRK